MAGKLFGLLAVLAGLVAADTAFWLLTTRVLTSGIKGWIERAQVQGWVISAGERVEGGWPFAATLIIDRPAISGGNRVLPGGLTWSADRVILSISLRHPRTLTISPRGQQFLRLSHLPDLGFTAGHALAHLPLSDGREGEGDFEAEAISGGIAGSRHPQDVTVASLSVLVSDAQQEAGKAARRSRILVNASFIGLPDIGRWPLGATIASAAASLAVSSAPLPEQPASPVPGQSRAAAQAAAWRDGGGVLLVRDAALRWGPLLLNGEADLMLDSRLQPAGSGTADVAGTAAALDAAVQGGLVSQGVASTAKAVLAVMPRAPDGTAIRLPFLLRDSTISVGAIPIARLAEIGWQRVEP